LEEEEESQPSGCKITSAAWDSGAGSESELPNKALEEEDEGKREEEEGSTPKDE
jgi:hypothetical protein